MTVSQAETHYLDYFVIILNIIVILFLVALNGFFVASEFSIVKVRPSRLDTLIKEGSKSAVYARQVTEHLDAYLSVTQLGITLASLGLGWIGEPAVAKMLAPVFALLKLPPQLEHTLAFVVGFSVITALHIGAEIAFHTKNGNHCFICSAPADYVRQADVPGSMVFKPCCQLDFAPHGHQRRQRSGRSA